MKPGGHPWDARVRAFAAWREHAGIDKTSVAKDCRSPREPTLSIKALPHLLSLMGNTLQQNPFYIPPGQMLREMRGRG